MMSEQTELPQSLRLVIEEKSNHEKVLQEQVNYLTKKLFGSSSEKRAGTFPGSRTCLTKRKSVSIPAGKKRLMKILSRG
jgi:hypothetical protein